MLYPHYSPYCFSTDAEDNDSLSDSSISGESSEDEGLDVKKQATETSSVTNNELQRSVHVKDDKFLANRGGVEDKTRQKTKRNEKAKPVAEFDYDISNIHPPFE